MNSRTKLEDDVCAPTLSRGEKKFSRSSSCTFPTHADSNCPAKDLECFDCGKKRHFSGSKSCKKEKGQKSTDKKEKKTKTDEEETEGIKDWKVKE